MGTLSPCKEPHVGTSEADLVVCQTPMTAGCSTRHREVGKSFVFVQLGQGVARYSTRDPDRSRDHGLHVSLVVVVVAVLVVGSARPTSTPSSRHRPPVCLPPSENSKIQIEIIL